MAVALMLERLRQEGFMPDLVIGHSGWGETLKDIRPLPPEDRGSSPITR